jgi:signal transduction histidine kinase
VFSVPENAAVRKQGQLERNAYYMAVLLVLGATTFGAYLLWSDLGRELRLAELRSQFVASVSHELKTPLTAIRMFAETLQMGRQPSAQTQAEYLDTIVNECERLTRLVDNVLQFSRIEQGKKVYQFRQVQLAEAVSAAARAMQYPLEQKGFQLRISLEDGLPAMRADADALQQAVLNLLTNAMKYSGESRVIELELRRQEGEAVIRVRDHGVGIAPEQHTLIFEKFYRVPTAESQHIPGTGLGLTLVAHTAKAHGGRVEVRSAPGEGSTFSLCLPLGSES